MPIENILLTDPKVSLTDPKVLEIKKTLENFLKETNLPVFGGISIDIEENVEGHKVVRFLIKTSNKTLTGRELNKIESNAIKEVIHRVKNLYLNFFIRIDSI